MPKQRDRCIGGKFTGRQMDCTSAVARLANMVAEHACVGKICLGPIVSGLRCGNKLIVKVSNNENCISLTVIQGKSKQSLFAHCSPVNETRKEIEAMLLKKSDITVKSV